jgi:hypothetical protein
MRRVGGVLLADDSFCDGWFQRKWKKIMGALKIT